MISIGHGSRNRTLILVEESPLRRADPRVKLALSLSASLAVMMPLTKLALFMVLYLLILAWAKLLPQAARQVWRLKWILVVLFIVDWWLVDLYLATIIPLRLILLAGTFTLFFATTTLAEFRLTLEWLRVPYRYAFSLSLAFQSMTLLDEEWRNIKEAQQARGAWNLEWRGWRNLPTQVGELVSLTVPAIVLTTKRAWGITEAAYARGFDSPHRCNYRRLTMRPFDWLLLAAVTLVAGLIVFWR